MTIIGVVDLKAGAAVHAQGGCRARYQPVDTVAGMPVQGDAETLARAYAHLGVHAVYVADLDAIAGGSEQDAPVRRVAAQTQSLWLDAGVSTLAQARRATGLGASIVVVGLETLRSFADLAAIVQALGADAVAFSLDLRDGRPMAVEALRDVAVDDLARRAVDAGVRQMIVLDVARVGSSRGPDLRCYHALRRTVPEVMLVAGGSVRHVEDLRLLASAGCDGALMATALQRAGAASLVRDAVSLTVTDR